MHRFINRHSYTPIFEADTGSEGAGATETATDQTAGDANAEQATGGIDQAELERIASERSARAEKAALQSYLKQQGLTPEEAAGAFESYKQAKAAKAEEDRNSLTALQAENAELQRQAQETAQIATNRLIKAEATLIAASLGVRTERVDAVVKFANLAEVTVDEQGNVDKAAVRSALESTLDEFPEFKTSSEEARTGIKVGGPGQQSTENNEQKLKEIFGIKE